VKFLVYDVRHTLVLFTRRNTFRSRRRSVEAYAFYEIRMIGRRRRWDVDEEEEDMVLQ